MKILNMAVVGYGGMGSWHVDLLKELEMIQVKGICDISPERQKLAKEKGLYRYTDLKEILRDSDIDFLLCATPNDLHKDITIEALKAGKHVVCEKPATMSSQYFMEMVKAAEDNNKKLFIHQNRRWDEDYLTVKHIYNNNALGNIFRIESRVHGSRGIPGDWRNTPEHGGGMVLDWGVHILDQALMMIPGKVKSVYAKLTYITNELVDDGFMVELIFENGLEFRLEVGTNNFITLPRWYVLGINGSAVIQDWNLTGEIVKVISNSESVAVPIKTAAGLTKTMAPRTDDTIIHEKLPYITSDIKDFYKNIYHCILGEEEAIVKNHEVLRVIKLMEAIFKSAKQNEVIEFNG